ncbi:MAG: glucose-1-phosphate thymidylyltransferase [Flavobacteriales bacterium]|nr:glucose-1-phosphate thymidylyltransferase [Flavobacteriales bacterium]
MKGIILAGGKGTRLSPSTDFISKQLLPVFDKPMIYYPMSSLMLAGIREILIISTERDLPLFKSLLGNGDRFGLSLSYKIQKEPEGIPQALLLAEEFLEGSSLALILGDNIFYGHNFTEILNEARNLTEGAHIISYPVKDPKRFGIVEIDSDGKALSIEEKPKIPKSNLAVTGLYFYENRAINLAKSLKPSSRGELEISDLNTLYLKENNLRCTNLGRGFAWLDTGTNEALLSASRFVETIEERQGFKIACLEEIALQNNWVDKNLLDNFLKDKLNSDYYKYVKGLLNG